MPAMRAQASAIYVGVITIVASLGPVFVSSHNHSIITVLGGGVELKLEHYAGERVGGASERKRSRGRDGERE